MPKLDFGADRIIYTYINITNTYTQPFHLTRIWKRNINGL